MIKLSPDLDKEIIDAIIAISRKYKIDGFIVSNLTKKREKTNISEKEFSKVGNGGLSGKPTEKLSNELISYIYSKNKELGTDFIIIGCGGIFSATDAYEKIKRGASLVQLITGMIYEGPALIGKINKELVQLLEKNGYNNISEAIGTITN